MGEPMQKKKPKRVKSMFIHNYWNISCIIYFAEIARGAYLYGSFFCREVFFKYINCLI